MRKIVLVLYPVFLSNSLLNLSAFKFNVSLVIAIWLFIYIKKYLIFKKVFNNIIIPVMPLLIGNLFYF